jgi:hypothetical protein
MTIGERGARAVVDSEIHAGQAPGHRARHIIDGSDWAATDPFPYVGRGLVCERDVSPPSRIAATHRLP